MSGIPILGCLPGSPAEQVGLQYGDILLSVNGQAVTSIMDFLRVRAEATDMLEVIVQRGNRILELTMDLREAKKRSPADLLGSLLKMSPDQLLVGATPPPRTNSGSN